MKTPRFAPGWKTILAASLALVLAHVAGAVSPQPSARPSILFLVSEDPNNYEAHRTIPPYAQELARAQGFRVTVIQGEGPQAAFRYPGLIEALSQADLLVFFSRRVAPTREQLQAIKDYLKAGKPLVGIRTANHGFTLREPVAEGHEAWPEFVADILGSENRGYGAVQHGTKVSVAPGAADHPILKGFQPAQWHSTGNIYHSAPLLDPNATVLLIGEIPGKTEPIAWTRQAGASRIFYTSLGHPTDFDVPQFRTLLTNAIIWGLGAKAPSAK